MVSYFIPISILINCNSDKNMSAPKSQKVTSTGGDSTLPFNFKDLIKSIIDKGKNDSD